MLVPLKFQPGQVRDLTNYSNQGGWFSCNWIRFRAGLPEKMGGWSQKITTAFLGVCRALFAWAILTGQEYWALGTNLKFYVSDTTSYTDVTPIRLTTNPMANNPFATTNGNTTIVVTDVAHGAVTNDFVTFSGATGGFAGLVAADLNKEFQITNIVDASHYNVVLSVTPNATTSGGGAAVIAAYQINTGPSSATAGLGFGASTWSRGTWGSAATTGPTIDLRLWSIDNFGEDLITCVRNGGIYHWDATSPFNRMVALSALGGASDAPTIATAIMVSAQEAHTIAFGCNPLGSGTQDPLFVRWADTESYLDWTPTATNTAGGYRLSSGAEIAGVCQSRNTILIWTDIALYTMTWTGTPYIFSFQQIGYNISIISPNASITFNDVTYWMGETQFYAYDGRILVMPCTITDYIFNRIDLSQVQKIYAFSNSAFNEVGWLYQSDGSTTGEVDSYVIFNVKENVWYSGMVNRTAWLDLGIVTNPIATSPVDNLLYSQEFGFDDGSTNPPTAIDAYIESSPMEVPTDGPGDHYLFLSRLIPDLTFRNSTATTPQVTMTLKTIDYPGSATAQTYNSQVSSSVVDQFTSQCFIRLRGRSAVFRCESNTTGVTWRLGVPRVEMRIDGRR